MAGRGASEVLAAIVKSVPIPESGTCSTGGTGGTEGLGASGHSSDPARG
jgi:hypothetical protein